MTSMTNVERITDPTSIAFLDNGTVLRDVDGDTWQIIKDDTGAVRLKSMRSPVSMTPQAAMTYAPYKIVPAR